MVLAIDLLPDTPAGLLAVTILAIWLVLMLVTASRHRKHAGRTDLKPCSTCLTLNPPHAKYCRHCGKTM